MFILQGSPPYYCKVVYCGDDNCLPQRRIDQICQGGKMIDVLQCRNYQGQADCLFLQLSEHLHASSINTEHMNINNNNDED